MNFIRPEVRAALVRWREAMAGAAVLVLGLWWALTSLGLIRWAGVGLILIGAALTWAGVQRGRVRPRTGGPGVIELDEGQLTYLHADFGSIVALPSVLRIEIETTDAGPFADDLFWCFHLDDGHMVRIPGSAVGSERLIDALASFNGADYEAVIAASASTSQQLFVIWQKQAARLH